MSERFAFHATTPKRLARYRATGAILPPVRFFGFEARARQWGGKTQRLVLLRFPWPEPTYPLPDHQPSAYFTPSLVRVWEVV